MIRPRKFAEEQQDERGRTKDAARHYLARGHKPTAWRWIRSAALEFNLYHQYPDVDVADAASILIRGGEVVIKLQRMVVLQDHHKRVGVYVCRQVGELRRAGMLR